MSPHLPILPRVAAAVTLAIGLAVLTGWIFGISALRSVLPGEAEMEANAAIGLLLAAGSLFILNAKRAHSRRDAQMLAFAVLLLGLATLGQYIFDVDLHIDELFFRDTTDPHGKVRGRMSPYSAVAFVGIGLALSSVHSPSLRPLVWAASGLVALIGVVPIAGYLANVSAITANRWLSPMAGTIAFVLLGVGTILSAAKATDRDRTPPARTPMEKKVLAAFAGALLLLFLGAGFTYRASLDFAQSAQGISRSEQLRDALGDLYLVLTAAESAQTAYLLTSREQQRDEYQRLAARARAFQQSIADLAAEDASQSREFAELNSHVKRRLDLLADVTRLYDENGLSSARELVASDEGALTMREILAVTTRMDARGEQVLLEREATRTRTRQLMLGSVLLTLAVAAGIFLALFAGISREMAARAQADEALRGMNREMLELNDALARRAAEVEAANQELESFSYSVSHDLRAPLRHIDGYLEMLATKTAGQLGEEPRRYLEIIADSSRRMSALIDDLLAFSRMGRTELRAERVDLGDLVQEVIKDLEMATRGRTIEWRVEPLPAVSGDHAMLRQVLANLLGNAVKYTRPRDPARIEVGCSGDEIGKRVLFVRDNGVGFDMQHAAKLFGIFQRLHRTEEFDGTGIGLANVRRIITRHGGRVWAEAELDRGATFYFTLEPAHEAGSVK